MDSVETVDLQRDLPGGARQGKRLFSNYSHMSQILSGYDRYIVTKVMTGMS